MEQKNPGASPVSNTIFLKLLLLLTFRGRIQSQISVCRLRLMLSM